MKILLYLCMLIGMVANVHAVDQKITKVVLQQAFKKLDINIPIRVLLDEKPLPTDAFWKFGSRGGFLVFSPHDKQKTVYQVVALSVGYKNNSFYINGKKQSSKHIFIIPLSGTILFDKNVYDGVIALTAFQNAVYVVNHVDLEDYVLSVLPYESWPAWPDEVHKVFCIAFRSYGIAKVLEHRAQYTKSGIAIPYDIKNTNKHQIYKGRSYSARFKRIIDSTKGVVLAHKNKPILAMFDICCGDIIPGDKDGIHFSKAPHLKRTYPCTYCKEYKFYNWNSTYSFDDLESALAKELPLGGKIKDIKITSFDKAGVVKELKIKSKNQWVTISASKFKSCLKEIKSLAFTLHKSGRSITIHGKGHGHHMGLCQRGAYYMVTRAKKKHREILQFYYPGTIFMKLKKISY